MKTPSTRRCQFDASRLATVRTSERRDDAPANLAPPDSTSFRMFVSAIIHVSDRPVAAPGTAKHVVIYGNALSRGPPLPAMGPLVLWRAINVQRVAICAVGPAQSTGRWILVGVAYAHVDLVRLPDYAAVADGTPPTSGQACSGH